VIVGAAEHACHLKLAQLALHGRQGFADLTPRFLVIGLFTQFDEHLEVFNLLRQSLNRFNRFLQVGALTKFFLRFFRVVPEIRIGYFSFQLGNPLFLGNDVKDTSRVRGLFLRWRSTSHVLRET